MRQATAKLKLAENAKRKKKNAVNLLSHLAWRWGAEETWGSCCCSSLQPQTNMLIAAAIAAVRAIKTVNVSVKCFQVLCKSNEDVDDDGDDDEDADTQANHDHLLGKETPFGRFIMSSGQCEWNVGEFMRISQRQTSLLFSSTFWCRALIAFRMNTYILETIRFRATKSACRFYLFISIAILSSETTSCISKCLILKYFDVENETDMWYWPNSLQSQLAYTVSFCCLLFLFHFLYFVCVYLRTLANNLSRQKLNAKLAKWYQVYVTATTQEEQVDWQLATH